ncbi:hypothetical protein EV421DRAFT_1799885 [Armillaria borealis]|uniref:Uncharacterized protein n=1 Tax=Armillaria borealis TaxID=47425 RepID=A0AA39JLQ8_9AGAR|nr:hypothetical protein EV421DRAFT_1799885 [Armillaria borealis]
MGTQLPCFYLSATFFLLICDRPFSYFLSSSIPLLRPFQCRFFKCRAHIRRSAHLLHIVALILSGFFRLQSFRMQFSFALLAFFACLATSVSAAPYGMQSTEYLMVRDGKEHVNKKNSGNNAGNAAANATDSAAATDTATNATAVASSNSTADAAAAANDTASTVTVTVTAADCTATDATAATGVNATAATDIGATANATDVSAAANATDASTDASANATADANASATDAATTSTSSKKNTSGTKNNKSDIKTVITDLLGGAKKREFGRRGLVNRLISDGVLDL